VFIGYGSTHSKVRHSPSDWFIDHSPETAWEKRDGQERSLFSGGRIESSVAKAIYGEQAAFVVNDVIAMRTANSYAKSNRLSLIGSDRNGKLVWE
jgi:hypothetical protein